MNGKISSKHLNTKNFVCERDDKKKNEYQINAYEHTLI